MSDLIERVKELKEKYDIDPSGATKDEIYFEIFKQELDSETASLIENMDKEQLRGLLARLHDHMKKIVKSATRYNQNYDDLEGISMVTYMWDMCLPHSIFMDSSDEIEVELIKAAISKGAVTNNDHD